MAAINGVPDVVSDVLSLIRMRGEMVCANEYAAPWSFSFRKPIAHFHIMERGSAWIRVDGQEPTRIESGDLVVLPLGTGHVMSSDKRSKPLPIEQAIQKLAVKEGAVYRIGSGGISTHVVCGQFSFAGVLAPKLLTQLPPLMHIVSDGGRPLEWLKLTTHFLIEETRHPRPGSAMLVTRLLDLLFVQAIREWGARNPSNLDWMSGLSDARIGRVLSSIHAAPAQNWTVQKLAQVAGMSRSGLAARFTELVGTTPLKYLANWRLNLAADHLRASGARVSEIADIVGYGSEAALNRAFKSQFGTTPAAFRKQGGFASRGSG